MSIKESSDELNPPEVVHEVITPAHKHGPIDYLALAIATFGVGYLPIAPGTWGSLVGVGIWLLMRRLIPDPLGPKFLLIELIVTLAITFAGIWAASRTEHISGRKDPGKVVADEVAGQLMSLLPVVLVPAWFSWKVAVIISFILFRFFDIVKPYPARRLEAMHGGLGIMCDDLTAGIYAGLIIAVGALAISAI